MTMAIWMAQLAIGKMTIVAENDGELGISLTTNWGSVNGAKI